MQQRLGPALLGTASVFRYHMSELIDLTSDSTDGLYIYRNVGKASATGAELGLEARFGRGVLGYANYTYQHAWDEATDQVLSNSPSHMVKAGIAAPLASRVGGALEGRVESGRATVVRHADGSVRPQQPARLVLSVRKPCRGWRAPALDSESIICSMRCTPLREEWSTSNRRSNRTGGMSPPSSGTGSNE